MRASYGTPIRRTTVSGRIMGRNDNVCAQIAVTNMTGFSGCDNAPPAARLYAVEPVGVEMQMPSARTVVKCSSSPNNSIVDIAVKEKDSENDVVSQADQDEGTIARVMIGGYILGFGPRSTTTSLRI